MHPKCAGCTWCPQEDSRLLLTAANPLTHYAEETPHTLKTHPLSLATSLQYASFLPPGDTILLLPEMAVSLCQPQCCSSDAQEQKGQHTQVW